MDKIGERCMGELLETYDLIKHYESPLKDYNDLLRFEYQDILLLQKKNTGEVFVK